MDRDDASEFSFVIVVNWTTAENFCPTATAEAHHDGVQGVAAGVVVAPGPGQAVEHVRQRVARARLLRERGVRGVVRVRRPRVVAQPPRVLLDVAPRAVQVLAAHAEGERVVPRPPRPRSGGAAVGARVGVMAEDGHGARGRGGRGVLAVAAAVGVLEDARGVAGAGVGGLARRGDGGQVGVLAEADAAAVCAVRAVLRAGAGVGLPQLLRVPLPLLARGQTAALRHRGLGLPGPVSMSSCHLRKV